MKHKVSVARCLVRGVSLWRVRWHESGRVRRKFFSARESADAHAAFVRADAISTRQKLLTLPQQRLDQLLVIHAEAEKRGLDLLALLTMLKSAKDKPTAAPSVAAVIDELLLTKRKAGRDNHYLDRLRCILEDFSGDFATVAIDQVGLAEVEKYLDSKNLVSRSSYRSRLSTLLGFAVRRGYLVANPCTRLEQVTVTRPPPAIFTVPEVEKCLAWLQQHPRMFGWFVLSTFAGLRPEEAEKTTWADINFTEGWIRVEAQTTKVRQRRVIYPKPTVFQWLRVVEQSKPELTITRPARVKNLVLLRKELGWEKWKKDVTRHSCASYWLSDCGSAATVATALGHSERTLRKHYLGLCTKVEAEKFWNVLPGKVKA